MPTPGAATVHFHIMLSHGGRLLQTNVLSSLISEQKSVGKGNRMRIKKGCKNVFAFSVRNIAPVDPKTMRRKKGKSGQNVLMPVWIQSWPLWKMSYLPPPFMSCTWPVSFSCWNECAFLSCLLFIHIIYYFLFWCSDHIRTVLYADQWGTPNNFVPWRPDPASSASNSATFLIDMNGSPHPFQTRYFRDIVTRRNSTDH